MPFSKLESYFHNTVFISWQNCFSCSEIPSSGISPPYLHNIKDRYCSPPVESSGMVNNAVWYSSKVNTVHGIVSCLRETKNVHLQIFILAEMYYTFFYLTMDLEVRIDISNREKTPVKTYFFIIYHITQSNFINPY